MAALPKIPHCHLEPTQTGIPAARLVVNRLGYLAGRLLLVVLVLGCLSRLHAQSAVDFGRDVQPILQRHCWKCHSADRAEGGLRLDERKFAAQGGGSGENLLDPGGTRNELLRRVKSTVDGERMPLEGPALADQEIATLERWIVQGAFWPEEPAPRMASEDSVQERWLARWEQAVSPRYISVWIAAIVVLALILVLERINARLEKRISRAWHLVGLLCVALFAALQYAREQTELRERATRSHNALTGSQQHTGKSDPFRPQHPRRLGGAYYRGNDERSDELFNGGFYRTATFHIHLAGADGEPLQWGDPLPSEPHLRFEIVRSPHASPSLFAPNIMEQVALSAVQPEQLKTQTGSESSFTSLHEQEQGERWSCLFPLAAIPDQGRLSGKVYVYSEAKGGVLKNPAYLIGYELAASEGTIAKSSQIWMASVYNISKLQWPEPGKIPADQWFDFRPIPEIEKP